MPIILNGTTGITTPGITNTGPFTFQGTVELPAGTVGAPSLTTTGDTNTGIYFPAADTIGFVEGGVEALRINSSAQIAVNTAGTAGAPVITKTDDLNTGIFFPAADTIAFTEGGVESMRIDASGNVGIGVTPSAWSTAGNLQSNNFGSKVDGVSFANNAYFNSGWKYASNGFAGLYSQVNGQHIFYTAPTGTVNNAVSLTQALTLTAAGNLGLGTTSPGNFNSLTFADSILDVNGIIQVRGDTTNNIAAFQFGGDTYRKAVISSPIGTDTPYLAFAVATNGSASSASEVMRLTSTGNVGIGTTGPIAKLHVKGSGAYDGYILADNSSTTGGGIFGIGVNGTRIGFLSTSGSALGDTSQDIAIFNETNNGIRLYTNSTERARILSGGNFCIGATSGGYKLNVVSATGAGLQVTTAGATTNSPSQDWYDSTNLTEATLTAGNGLISFGAYSNTPLALITNNAERLRIAANGIVSINTTGLANNGYLSVNTTVAQPAARFYSSGGDGAICVMVDKSSSTNTTSQWFLGFTINAQTTASGVITANGASQAAFGSWSDQRLKKNIVDIPSQWANIKALRPVEFDYIESEGGGHQTSFIAQEFEQVYPDAIGERPDGMKTLTGWGKTEARLVKVLQEAMLRIEQLEADMAVMKGLN